MLSRVIRFITTDIWRMQARSLSPINSFFVRVLRVIILSIRGYMEDNCMFRASALTFYTLLSVVPVIAVIFAIANGFGLKDRVEEEIRKAFTVAKQESQVEEFNYSDQPVVTNEDSGNEANGGAIAQEEAVDYIIKFANKALSIENIKSGVFEGVAIAFFLLTIIKVLGNIENSFNHIWGIKRSRHIGRKFSDYLSVVLICPIFMVLAQSITVATNDTLKPIWEKLPSYISNFWPVIEYVLSLSKFFIVWFVFTFLFMFMPNTRVRFRSGMLAGLVSGTIFVLVQMLYVELQIGVARYGAIYGSFATLPLFLIWLQMSWFIVLYGAELAFAYQNVDTYEFEPDCLKASYSLRRFGAIAIMQILVKNFCKGEQAIDAENISQQLEMPVRLVRDLLFELVEVGLVTEVRCEEKGRFIGFQPGIDVDLLKIKYVMDKLEKHGVDAMPMKHTKEMDKIEACLAKIASQMEHSDGNMLLKNI